MQKTNPIFLFVFELSAAGPRAHVCCFYRDKAERLAKLSVSDPILYAIERRREANEINGTKV